MLLTGKRNQQNPQNKKQKIYRKKSDSVKVHVFLRSLQGPYREIFLHHILIEPRHNNRYEYAAEKLLKKILFCLPIIKNKYPIHTAVPDRIHHSGKIELHLIGQLPNYQH